MTVLSVDLACRSYSDNGVVALTHRGGGIAAEILRLRAPGRPKPDDLAVELDALARARSSTHLLLDGPQGWKDPDSGLAHARRCEHALATPAKTGLPGACLPGTWLEYVTFSVAVFERLIDLGWRLFGGTGDATRDGSRVLVETFPTAAWRLLRLRALPGKSRATAGDVELKFRELLALYPITVDHIPSHDELQAIIAGLAGLSLARGAEQDVAWFGVAPFRRDGSWREGYIVCPRRNGGQTDSDARPPTDPASPVRTRPTRGTGRTTCAGSVNRNSQEVVRATDRPGTDHNSRTYLMRCRPCGHEYGANGTDIWQRRCPSCQGGAPGNPL